MKILMLVLASDGYEPFYALWRKYMNSNPNIDCFFYRGNPDMEKDAELVDDTIYVKIGDTLDTVYEKLMLTLKFLEPKLRKYDFFFRTNLSSFIDFNKYVHFCLLLPTENTCAAVIGHHDEIPFPSGAGFTMTMDLVRRLVYENPPPYHLDDVTIGKAISKWGVQWIRANRLDFQGNGVWVFEHKPSPNELLFHYRAKTDDREEDCRALESILNNILQLR